MFETISFLGNKKTELRSVGRRDQAAMEQDALLNFWAKLSRGSSAGPLAPAC